MSAARKPTDLVALMLRLPEPLRRQIARDAKANRRSLNAEVNYRLQASFQREQEDERAFAIAVQAVTIVMQTVQRLSEEDSCGIIHTAVDTNRIM